MDVMPVLSTLAGGAVGAGSAFMIDWTRRRHESRARFVDRRSDAYEQYLASLVNTDASMRTTAQEAGTPVERDLLMNVFHSHSILALRYRVHLIGRGLVVESSDDVYRKLRSVREAMIETPLPVGVRESDEWQAVHRPYRLALRELVSAMRQDVQRPQ